MTDPIFDLKRLEDRYDYIAGIDEVGRGCLFGDVVAACVIMPIDDAIEGITDSKKLTPKKRALYEPEIKARALAYGFGRETAETIDRINIKQATRRAMVKAAEAVKTQGFEEKNVLFLIDAETIDIPYPQQAIVHGDDLSYNIACASILAKEYRDRLCIDWDREYPGYGIGAHKGYGTKKHREALLEKGPSELHRRSFLKKILGEGPAK
ncbi:MAG: ribonuclease HII [Peptoniphilus sp.]|nr:ribonuclease HII [Peptoniphilus sp.]MDD7362909.1 ribonuclease HII [Bacillota bacterium]MDY6044149.1 ribonuclease HII [Peptoniphilus sp.]